MINATLKLTVLIEIKCIGIYFHILNKGTYWEEFFIVCVLCLARCFQIHNFTLDLLALF